MRVETRVQIDILAELDRLGFWGVHVPNGTVLAGDGRQRAIQMNALKRAGLRIGFPDLIVYGPLGVGHIEVKKEGEMASDTQMEVEDKLTGWGQRYAVCRSVQDVVDTLKGWGWL